MLRSQSIFSLNDQRKSKTSGFLSTLRSKKSSSYDLHSNITSSPTSIKSKPRPLSSSVSSINLNQTYNDSLEQKNNYSSTVARQRNVENKENIVGTASIGTGKSPNKEHARQSIKFLKTRSSVPNLKKSKRGSTFLVGGHLSGVANIDRFVNISHEKTSDKLDEISIEGSPMTPETLNTVDSLMDQTSIKLIDFDNDDLLDDENKEEGSMKLKKLHRTTNLQNINELFKLLNPLNEKLPLNNRKSLDFESFEIKKILDNLNDNQGYISNLKLVENVLFLLIEDSKNIAKINSNNQFNNTLDNIDYSEIIKNESYNDDDDDQFYLSL